LVKKAGSLISMVTFMHTYKQGLHLRTIQAL